MSDQFKRYGYVISANTPPEGYVNRPRTSFSPVFLQTIKLFQVSKSYQSKFSSVRAKIGSISKKACHNFETVSKSNVTGSHIINVV